MEFLRTPDEYFANLPGYDFDAHYCDVNDTEGGDLRIHYCDEGPRDGENVLMLHGEPSWSYLYRKMIPIVTGGGYRVIAPDLVGFGKSDKPSRRVDYTYGRHVLWMQSFIDRLGLDNTTLFCQDWGGLIGLRLVAQNPDRFKRVMAANTMLPTGDFNPGEAFMKWRDFSQTVAEFPIGGIIQGATTTTLSDEVVAAYDAPFPDERYKEGARQFPALVPVTPDDPASDDNRRAWEVLKKWERPFMTAFSDNDPITRGGDLVLQKLIPGARGRKHYTVRDAGHFLQEDRGEELAGILVRFIGDNP